MKDLFTYKKGALYNSTDRSWNCLKGSVAGSRNPAGYMQVNVKGKRYYVHRIIWEMFNGPIPEGSEIDHINRVRCDNRIENLRLVSSQENKFNKTGTKGYFKRSNGTYRAYIWRDRKCKSLGTYKTSQQAREAYLKAKEIYHQV